MASKSKRRSSEIIRPRRPPTISDSEIVGGGALNASHRRSNSWTLSEYSEHLSDDEEEHSLAEQLTNQRWHEIGNGPYPLCATGDFEVMVDQLSSILAMRLRDMLIYRLEPSRRHSDDATADDRGGAGNGDATSGSVPVPVPEQTKNNDAVAQTVTYLRIDPIIGDYVLKDSILKSMRDYVGTIGRLYNKVGFHSFEHAAHVTTSMNKLLYLVRGVDNNPRESWTGHASQPHMGGVCAVGGGRRERYSHDVPASDVSFGIGGDPRIPFAMLFSALIHDVGHTGVPNSVLVEEEDELAILHNDVSVAEQNSLQVAFSTLQRDEFAGLKRCICPTPQERRFFRKKVICMVMVTDISDQERIQIVASRWNAAFPKKSGAALNGGVGGGVGRGSVGSLSSAEPPDVQSVDTNGSGQTQQKPLTQDRPPERRLSRRCSSQRHNAEDPREIKSTELRASLRRRRFTMFTTDAAAKEFANHPHNRRLGIRTSMDFSGMLLDAYRTMDQLQQHAVLETMMNVADVAHTMQSFTIFCKWNRRLYKEFYTAHLRGRLTFNPEDNWYENQIGFFSHYIIPLSRKMKTCGVFGTTGNVFEYFATENKKRWVEEGELISVQIMEDVKEEVEREKRLTDDILCNGCH